MNKEQVIRSLKAAKFITVAGMYLLVISFVAMLIWPQISFILAACWLGWLCSILLCSCDAGLDAGIWSITNDKVPT